MRWNVWLWIGLAVAGIILEWDAIVIQSAIIIASVYNAAESVVEALK